MTQLPSYKSEKGETFTIQLEEPAQKPEANFWGFYFIVSDSKDRKKAFRLVIKKKFIADQKDAAAFAVQHPFQNLCGLLEFVDEGRGPLFLPDSSKGWEVY
jgi:hypothetical protein